MLIKELEDYDWFPKTLRRFQMQAIGYMAALFRLYKPVIPLLEELIAKHQSNLVIDLCSGSGLPSMYIQERMNVKTPFVLTDKYPQTIATNAGISYSEEPLSVLDLVPEQNALYTMYNAFHHFTDAEKMALLKTFKEHHGKLCIVEIITPNLQNILQVIIASTVVQLLITPFRKPFSLTRILFTYIIPVNILTVLIDGIITVFKCKTKKQYQQLTQSLNSSTYSIETNTIFSFPNKIVVITAQPIYVHT